MKEYTDQSGRTEPAGDELTTELSGPFLSAPVDITGSEWFVSQNPIHENGEMFVEVSMTIEGVVSDDAAEALEYSYRLGDALRLSSPMSSPLMEVVDLEIDDGGGGQTHVDAKLVEVE